MSVYPQLVNEAHLALVELLESKNFTGPLTREKIFPLIKETVRSLPALKRLFPGEEDELIESVINRVLGHGPLEPLLADPTVTEIMVNGPKAVFVEQAGLLRRAPIFFADEEELLQTINRIVGGVGRRIDESQPLVDARLPDGSRLNAVIPPLSRIGPVLTIRRFPPEPFTLSKLAATGAISLGMENFLRALVRARQNVLIAGSTGSGKTSLLNALAGSVGGSERLVTIEDTAEIRLVHPHLVALESRPPNLEGAGEVTIRTLLKNALRMRPDRIIVGEARGAEALDMLQAMNTGHAGSLATIHASAPLEALHRLETMALMADSGLPMFAVREQIKSAVAFVIQLERLPGGQRKVVSIAEQNSLPGQNEPYLMTPIYIYNRRQDKLEATGQLPARLNQFEAAGVEVDLNWFA